MNGFAGPDTRNGQAISLHVAAALALTLLAAPAANAQSSLAARLATERLAEVRPGNYQAGDDRISRSTRDDGHYLLRFKRANPEIFVLYADHASLGGRVLKYDSGETAMQIAGWGGMTLYTDKKPGGLPAVRTGNSAPPAMARVSLDAVKKAASDEAEHLAYVRRLALRFSADWTALAGNAALRALCFDTLENAARGIDRFAATPAGRKALSYHVTAVLVATGGKPTLHLQGKTLTVTFDPDIGYAGRASSRAIARALGLIFHVEAEDGLKRQTRPGSKPGGASSKLANSNPGATVQPTSVKAPSVRAACQAPFGTTSWGWWPPSNSLPSV